ncbi:methylglyoxal synthase [Ruegeria faecimaris]|uniref:Methylglyoxal synthase n=2 Tax=Ruegeria faecimaris TaxID=686389 RepID=A0A521EPT0_9RHOB|nr:methylglyoxal synthase [Ruegeria faecimaris]SMO85391.1 methylglyoxal synthase [Ruegeria faecimaris]
MSNDARIVPTIRSMALVAHDQMKDPMIEWANAHKPELERLELFGTGTTGGRIAKEAGLQITCLKSGPLGGDAQIGALIAEERLDALVFLIDPLSALPHDVDVKSLLRLATLYNTALAINPASATLLVRAASIEPPKTV